MNPEHPCAEVSVDDAAEADKIFDMLRVTRGTTSWVSKKTLNIVHSVL